MFHCTECFKSPLQAPCSCSDRSGIAGGDRAALVRLYGAVHSKTHWPGRYDVMRSKGSGGLMGSCCSASRTRKVEKERVAWLRVPRQNLHLVPGITQ